MVNKIFYTFVWFSKFFKALDCIDNIHDRYNDELDGFPASLPGDTMALLNRMMAGTASGGTAVHMPFDSVRIKLPNEDVIRSERNERKRTAKERLNRIQLSDEQRSLHFVRKQKEYDVEVKEKLLELEEWYDDFLTFEVRTPSEQEFADKFQEIKEELKGLDSRINPDFLFENGPDDVVRCGRILIKNENKWNSSDEQKAVCLMSAYQWLLRKRNEIFPVAPDLNENVDTNSPNIGTSEDEELVKVFMQLHLGDETPSLTINNNVFTRGKILAAVMHMYQADGKEWAANPFQLSKKIVACIPDTKTLSAEEKNKKAQAIAKCINRGITDIKGIHLKDLSVETIMESAGCLRKVAIEVYNQWDGLYSYVLRCRDNIRGQQGDTKETG